MWSRELPEWCDPAATDTVTVTRRWLARSRTTGSGSRRSLLDYMRRELAIKVDALDAAQPGGAQAALEPAVERHVGDRRAREVCRTARPCSPVHGWADDQRSDVYLSPRGGFGLYLRRHGTFPLHRDRLPLKETERIIAGLLEALRLYGLVGGRRPGVDRSARARATGCRRRRCVWLAGDGDRGLPRPDPGAAGTAGRRPHATRFSLDLYRSIVDGGQGIEAREHTAQVRPEQREEREREFRAGKLPAAVLLADDGAGRRHRLAERREPAQRAADAGQLRAALGPRRAQRAAGAGVHVLLDAGTATTSTSSAAPSGWSLDRSRRHSSISPTRISSARTCTRSG